MIVAHFALVFAFLLGYLLAEQISTRMIQNHLLTPTPEFQVLGIGGLNDFNQMGLSVTMSVEELIASYTITFDGSMFLILYVASVSVVAISTILPLVYLFRFSPQKILINS